MINQLEEDIERHIKTHSSNSVEDCGAISVLENFLRSEGRINPSFTCNDKWPNHDGTFEFVSNPSISCRPKQVFCVQIKGTHYYTEKDGIVKYSLKDLAFPAFIWKQVTLDPGIIFVVLNPTERGSERVFWKYMSVEFLNSIDFSKDSVTLYFQKNEEILDNDESILMFCQKLEQIYNHHSFVNKLERKAYSENDVKRIILACSNEISDSIERLDVLNENRDNVSQRMLTKLSDLCFLALLLNAINDGYEQPNLALAWEHSLLNIETKYLGNFYRGLVYIGRKIPDDGQSERLMLKYYDFMWQIRYSLQKKYNIKILENLEKFLKYAEIDEVDQKYYELVANAFNKFNYDERNSSGTRFYIEKKIPFYIEGKRYFEITLQQASIYASKYNRITIYTQQNISTSYPIVIEYATSKIDLWNSKIEVKIITSWKVSIDPRCLNMLSQILKIPLSLSSKYGEYDALMCFLTKTGMNFWEMINLCEKNFYSILEDIYKQSNTKYFKDVLIELKNKYSKGSKHLGKYTIRYLLLNLREDLLEKVLPIDSNSQMNCKSLYMSNKCLPFEINPLISNLVGSKTNTIDQARSLATIVEKEKIELAIPYWIIMKHIQKTGEIYCDLDARLDENSIKKYNNQLTDWEKEQSYTILINNSLVCIESYENSTLFILNELLKMSHLPNKGQKEFNEKYLRDCGMSFLDSQKKETLKLAFVNSRVLLIYGAAGTGKTTLIDMISTMMKGQKKLFLTKTHTALQNLKRIVQNPGVDSDFISLDSYTSSKRVNLTEYDVIFVDECSIIDNRSMKKFLNKIQKNTFLVLSGDIYQIESIEFGNWFSYAKDIIKSSGANVELLSTWRTKDQNLINLWQEVRNKGPLITEKLVIDGPFSENIGENIFINKMQDEVILCLNYDGKFGVNNMNKYFQSINGEEAVIWDDWAYKVGDPILFIDTKRFSLLYNNLKGRIVGIEKSKEKIIFTVDISLCLTENDCKKDDIEFVDTIDEKTRIRFTVFAYEEEMLEEDRKKTIVPFQLAYAVVIHKAQGLEYKSVKIIIPSGNAKNITHGIFYTAITRAKERLKIYWSSETMQEIVSKFYENNLKSRSLSIIKGKLEV